MRQVPDDLPADQIESALEEIAGELLVTRPGGRGGGPGQGAPTMACKAAIKGGLEEQPQEQEAVARAVLSGQVKYCPHGK